MQVNVSIFCDLTAVLPAVIEGVALVPSRAIVNLTVANFFNRSDLGLLGTPVWNKQCVEGCGITN